MPAAGALKGGALALGSLIAYFGARALRRPLTTVPLEGIAATAALGVALAEARQPDVALAPLGLVVSLLFLRRLRALTLTLVAASPAPLAVRLLAPLVRAYKFTEDEFYAADGAPADVQAWRRAGMAALAERFESSVGPRAREMNEALRALSDIRFTDTNRVPHPFQRVVRSHLRLGFIVAESDGPYVVDVDGNKAFDVSGSYGVNVHGYDFYKECMKEGAERTKGLGPNVLGPVHPVLLGVLDKLRAISGLDEVSFHMSGTEAIMCAVRLCRFNTRRPIIVQFAGAYHGWWDGVQPGPGNERHGGDVLTLKDMSAASLAVLRARRHEIAAVLVSPLQGLNPGAPPPSDVVLLDASARASAGGKGGKGSAYGSWLRTLRETCTSCAVPLLFDEVYTGFRMAVGGAQEYYGVRADMVAYGKTLGGGVPSGVVCGRAELMGRFDPDRPLRLCYVIGTFAAAPVTLGPMSAFLDYVSSAGAAKRYADAETRTAEWVARTNQALVDGRYPVRVDALTTVWTVLFTRPSRYHWMFQYYLRAEGLNLSWVGTGRCLFSFDLTDAHYEQARDAAEMRPSGAACDLCAATSGTRAPRPHRGRRRVLRQVTQALLNAASKMSQDGWWWEGATARAIKGRIVSEFLRAMLLPARGEKGAAPREAAKELSKSV